MKGGITIPLTPEARILLDKYLAVPVVKNDVEVRAAFTKRAFA